MNCPSRDTATAWIGPSLVANARTRQGRSGIGARRGIVGHKPPAAVPTRPTRPARCLWVRGGRLHQTTEPGAVPATTFIPSAAKAVAVTAPVVFEDIAGPVALDGPEPQCRVVAAAGDESSVRVHSHAADGPLVAVQDAECVVTARRSQLLNDRIGRLFLVRSSWFPILRPSPGRRPGD